MSAAAQNGGRPGANGAVDGDAPDETDNANYFCEYAYLYHQMDMLEDNHRTGTYYNAITHNPSSFKGKIVLDVGAGSGILSIFAANAGARHVYAVEATDMAVRARKIVAANGLADTITVLQGTVETVQLPCKVDVIVSEWMGYMLLRESMLDSVLVARDRFLKPGGAMFPSTATLYLAPVGPCKTIQDKFEQWQAEVERWDQFDGRMKGWYEVDYSCMKDEFMAEQRRYFLETATYVTLTPKVVMSPGRPIMELDLHTVSLEELKSPSAPSSCIIRITKNGEIAGFTGYFDTDFKGSKDNPTEEDNKLTTAPDRASSTHWGQQLFGFYPPLQGQQGDLLQCEMTILRQKKNHRLLHLKTKFILTREGPEGGSSVVDAREGQYYVD
mmetsp:Transcript_4860/g.11577  ORF Transcript_4860/g.11577 Transcript_4860/m.11577 type:complete len:385 (-) Transcript_4860:96-1250(-)|eukprot:CAMPEP_0206451548 /NCGR_PEP_ID=MMETSP0324_2-20121206/19409_1 /ASSEMBLY_ACC=CAM_ASM_000836 /TAXON_ID=2866 /ORGANISM="Crypthecodinium cohnii, Strain Seligo" /LENGTH=384 /DNA_ID=CAMNT_0053921455 /DNA_START=147 /DNA_END=1301 /DNA_ORIENTATION=-